MTVGVHSMLQNPGDNHYGVEIDPFQHQARAPQVTPIAKNLFTSFDRAGGTFTNQALAGEHLTGMSARSRTTAVNWDADQGQTPGFIK